MANIVLNIAKGRVAELYNRVKANDPTNSALIIVPIETTGLEADSVLIDKDDLAAFLVGATNEQTTMGRKTLDDTALAAFPAPDDTNDRYDLSLPNVTWTAATGNPISKLLVCYDADTTSGTDSSIIPLTLMDFVVTPSGTDIVMSTGVFYRAA
jgi:hypothetical protein